MAALQVPTFEYDEEVDQLSEMTAVSSVSEIPIEELELFIESADEPLRGFLDSVVGVDGNSLDVETAEELDLSALLQTAEEVDFSALMTAESDVQTAEELDLDGLLQTAHSDVETALDVLDDYVRTAESDVLTGLSAVSELSTCMYGEISDYEDPEAETDVNMDVLYPQAHVSELPMAAADRECYTPKPEQLSFCELL